MRHVRVECTAAGARLTIEELDGYGRLVRIIPLDDATPDVIKLASKLGGKHVTREEMNKIIYDVYHTDIRGY